MFEIWRKIKSFLLILKIETTRVFDHSYRRITGDPRVKHTMITPQLYLGGQYKVRGLQKFKSWGISAVVNMRQKSFERAQDASWLKYLHLPTPDMTPVSMKNLLTGVKFIAGEIESGGKVYIHCHHGEGRGPSMAIAYLISSGITFEDALAQVKRVRPFIAPTRAQLDRLGEFETQYKKLANPI